jgi:type IV pilus assembly protein PilO
MRTLRFNELTFDNAGQWPKAIQWSFLSGLGGFILILGYVFILQNEFDRYTSLQLQEETLKSQFVRKKYQALHLDSYKSRLQRIQRDFENNLKAFPEKNEMPVLLDDISKIGIQAGLKFTLFAPQKEQEHDFFTEFPVKISMRGTYFQLVHFLISVAQMTRIVTFHEFKIDAVLSAESYPRLKDQLEMTIQAKTYCYQRR